MEINRNIEYRIYARISKKEQKKGDKLFINQVSLLEDWLLSQNLNYEYHIYADDGATGRNIDRIGYQNMINDIKNGVKFVPVIAAIDRLNRNLHNAVHFYDLLVEHKLNILCQRGEIRIWKTPKMEIPDANGWLNYAIQSLFADFESRSISIRTMEALNRRGKLAGQPNSKKRKKYETKNSSTK